MNVLVIEDDHRIADLIGRGLSENGHQVSHSNNGHEGAKMLLGGSYDAALLDILLPGMSGLEVLEHVRSLRCKTAILMLTAVDAVPSILQAFQLGADDYVVKPFLLEILLARLTAVSRRGVEEKSPILKIGGIILDRKRRSVLSNGHSIHLTRKQFDLLDILLRRHGLITSREELIEAGWGPRADVKGNTLDVYVHGLRTKLDATIGSQKTMIRTVHGKGYILEVE